MEPDLLIVDQDHTLQINLGDRLKSHARHSQDYDASRMSWSCRRSSARSSVSRGRMIHCGYGVERMAAISDNEIIDRNGLSRVNKSG